MTLWDEVKKNLVDLYAVTSERTSELAKITSRRYDKFGISREIERQFSELGNLVYSSLKEGKTGILEDPALAALVKRVDELETELRLKDQQIEEIRKTYAAGKHSTGKTATVLTDPALGEGSGASAILLDTEGGDQAGATPDEDPDSEEK